MKVKINRCKFTTGTAANVVFENDSYGVEELQILREYAKIGNFETCFKYKLEPGDFDVMNHLALHNKLKTSEVMKVKKKMTHVLNEL